MPFTNISSLPSAVKVLPTKAQTMFLNVFNAAYDKYGEERAFKIAWSAVKKKFHKKDDKWVANSESFETPTYYYFDLADTEIVKNSETEEITFEGELTNTDTNQKGFSFTNEDLQNLETQINEIGGFGDVDHEYLNQLIQLYGEDTNKIVTEMIKKQGIAKAIQAKYSEGKLYIKGTLDKRYKNHATKFNKLSIEAVKPNDTRKVRYLGFSLTAKPSIPSVKEFELHA
jgi:cation transport regulator